MNYKNFIDKDLLEQHFQKSIKDVIKINEVLIIKVKKDFIVVGNGKDMLNVLLNKKITPYKDYYKIDVINFCNAIKKTTCKYQTFKQKKVYKYTLLQKFYMNKIENNKPLVSYLYEFEDIMKNKEVQKYFRKNKFQRVLQ